MQGISDSSRVTAEEWRSRIEAHAARAEKRTRAALQRRTEGRPHPVEDFLFIYYSFSFSKLREWHPPLGVRLESAEDLPPGWRKAPYRAEGGTVFADPAMLSLKELQRLRWMRELLVATRDRAPHFGCYGLHEWAMVYRGKEVRHRESAALRLRQEEVDAVVESRPICCSHFDAFRFFTPEAQPLNRLQPGLDSRAAHEQGGCIHANMDLYKWAGKAMPWVGTDLWFEAFELALQFRDLDMRASPYDLREYGLEPIPIENSEGRRTYEMLQRRLAESAAVLRGRLIQALEQVLAAVA